MRTRQDPPISQSQIPDAGILRATRNGVSASRPELHFASTVFRALLRRCRRNQEKQRRTGQGNTPANFSCHDFVSKARYRNTRKGSNDTLRATEIILVNLRATFLGFVVSLGILLPSERLCREI